MKNKPHERAAELVTKAVSAIVLDDPFYGYLLLRMEMLPADIPTACTNGKQIKYNPWFVANLTMPQLKGLLKHEVMHVAFMHHLRRGTRDADKWNVAADYVINDILIKANEVLPEGGLVDPQYADKSTEHVYDLLPDQSNDQPQGGSGQWNIGGVEDHPEGGPGASEDVQRQLEEDIKTEVLQAANAAKLMGKTPAGIERLIEKIRESKMPWRKILARFFRSVSKTDYTWLKPNRRFLAHDIYLPSLHSECMGPVVIGIDTSGSVSANELNRFFGCINGILKQTKPESVHVVYCDAAVGNVQVFKSSDYPISANKFKPSGGGGTAFEPVFNYVTANKLKPTVLLYLTDMYGDFSFKPPKYPVLWCATSNIKAPFGKTLEIT